MSEISLEGCYEYANLISDMRSLLFFTLSFLFFGGILPSFAGIEASVLRSVALAKMPLSFAQTNAAYLKSPSSSASTRALAQSSNDTAPLVANDSTKVAILGYHDFSASLPITDMRMRTSMFREQMQRIRDKNLTVISLQEFLEWRFGLRQLPQHCVLITIDDGWRSVYREAFPILKEYNYPFTLFLYTGFLSGRGQSMSPAMIREMMEHGASVGSHSVTHPYPSVWNKALASGADKLDSMIKIELDSSQKRLNRLFGGVNTYCYPGGFIMQEMVDSMLAFGYVAAFTVKPAKVYSKQDVMQIPRYIVFGNDNTAFEAALDFEQAGQNQEAYRSGDATLLPFPVYPVPNSTVKKDFGRFELDLRGVDSVDFSSLRMQISGYGFVPILSDSLTGIVKWETPTRMYQPKVSVRISWKTLQGESKQYHWTFRIEQHASVD